MICRQWLVLLAFLLCISVPAGSRMLYAGNGVFVVGSNTVLGIVRHLAEAHMATDPEIIISVSGGGTARGIKALQDGVAQIAMLSANLDDDDIKGGPPLRTYALSLDAVVPVVHPNNPVRSLTVDQLRSIFSGKYVNWQEVSGKNMPIVVLNHDGMSGTYEVWKEKILGENMVVTPRAQMMETEPMLQEVARQESAIGYVPFARLSAKIRPLAVEGVVPSKASIATGNFPLCRTLLLATQENPDAATLRVLNFFLDPQRGGKVQLTHGFIPATQRSGQ